MEREDLSSHPVLLRTSYLGSNPGVTGTLRSRSCSGRLSRFWNRVSGEVVRGMVIANTEVLGRSVSMHVYGLRWSQSRLRKGTRRRRRPKGGVGKGPTRESETFRVAPVTEDGCPSGGPGWFRPDMRQSETSTRGTSEKTAGEVRN